MIRCPGGVKFRFIFVSNIPPPSSVEIPVGDVLRVLAQRVYPEAVGLQVLDLLEDVLGIQPVLGQLLENPDPVPKGEVRKVDVVVQKGFALKRVHVGANTEGLRVRSLTRKHTPIAVNNSAVFWAKLILVLNAILRCGH